MEHPPPASGSSSAHGPAPAGATAAPDERGEVAGRQQKYTDDFMMFVFKVGMCKRVDKHDREKCPYAHPGELARRRHPSLYQALPCPEARAKKICPRLENCNCSHSTFEFWLHPDRYKTFLCERGAACNRPICFFAHSEEELRELPSGLQRTKTAQRTAADASSSHHHEQKGVPAAGQGEAALPEPGLQQQQLQQAHCGPLPGGSTHEFALQQRQQQRQQAGGAAADAAAHAQQPALAVGYGMSMLPAAGGPTAMGGQPGMLLVRPPGSQQRGRTVAVIPAGPSTWQGNALIEAEPGEAPSLEALCAAVARAGLAAQGEQQLAPQGPPLPPQFQPQPMGLPGQQGMQVAMLPAGMHYPAVQMLGGQPQLQPVTLFAPMQQPHQQQPPSQQQQQQQPDLHASGTIFVQVQPPVQGEGVAEPPRDLTWAVMPPGM